MLPESLELVDATRVGCADRIGMARLAKMAFDGWDLRPLCRELTAKLLDGTAAAGEGLDLSLIAQLLGEKQTGLAVQAGDARIPSAVPLALRCETIRGCAFLRSRPRSTWAAIRRSNSCLRSPAIELMMLYVVPGAGLPATLPDHDVAIVIASDSEDCRDALHMIDQAAPRWPRPLLNPPKLVCNLDRDKLYHLLHGIDGLEIPATSPVTRTQLLQPSASAGIR